jgi:hypothetical protein
VSNAPPIDWPLLPNVPGVTPENNLLSVSAKAEHPNLVNPPKGELKRGWERTPSNLRCRERGSRDPTANAGRSLQSVVKGAVPRALGAEHGPLRNDPGFEKPPERD